MQGITFGIVTDGKNLEQLYNLVESIRLQNIPLEQYEIVIIGGRDLIQDPWKDIRYIPFDEDQRPGHITRKKNIVVNTSNFSYICLLHDYFLLDKDWYPGLQRFNKENGFWQISTNRIVTLEGGRHSDWTVNPNLMDQFLSRNKEALGIICEAYPRSNPKYVVGLPYEEKGFNKIQYISGGYMFTEDFVLKEYPLDETLAWGQEEDVSWSQMVKLFFPFMFNPYSTVNLQKPGKWNVQAIPKEVLPMLAKFYGCQYAGS